jgi:hypothetical protein
LFWDRVLPCNEAGLELMCHPGWPQTCNLSTSTFWVLGLYHTWLSIWFCFEFISYLIRFLVTSLEHHFVRLDPIC